MKIKGQLQWTDYLNSQLLHMQPSGLIRIMIYGLLLVLGCGFIGGLYLFFTGQFEILLYFMPLFIFALLFLLYRFVILPNRVKKIFNQQKSLNSPFELEFTDTGMVASNEFGNSTQPWSNFIKWKENNELIMLYHSDIMYNIIPKRIFTDSQQIETIRAFLEKNKVPVAKNSPIFSSVVYLISLMVILLIIYIKLRNSLSQ